MAYDTDSPFFADLDSGRTMGSMPLAVWNLICTKRDLRLYTGPGKIRPHRGWKVTDVKRYFGIRGTGQVLMDNFMELHDVVMGALHDQEGVANG